MGIGEKGNLCSNKIKMEPTFNDFNGFHIKVGFLLLLSIDI